MWADEYKIPAQQQAVDVSCNPVGHFTIIQADIFETLQTDFVTLPTILYLSICLNKKSLLLLTRQIKLTMANDTCIRLQADIEQIKSCREKLKANSKSFLQLGQVLALAGNEVRLKILFLLEEENELCPCDLSDILGMSIPAISQHLRKLKDGNIIEARKVGQTIFYSLRSEHLKVLRPFFKIINQQNLATV